MRFLMKVPIPSVTENPVVGEADFNEKLGRLFVELGADKIFTRMLDGRRFDFAHFDIQDLSRLYVIAKPVSVWLKVKPEFLAETQAKPGVPAKGQA